MYIPGDCGLSFLDDDKFSEVAGGLGPPTNQC